MKRAELLQRQERGPVREMIVVGGVNGLGTAVDELYILPMSLE
jgi:hypothetical protein